MVQPLHDLASNFNHIVYPSHINRVASDHNTKGVVLDTPLWFNSTSFHTLTEWIVSSFEKAIWARYLQIKKNSPKKSLSFEALDFKMTLNYKRNLVEFWKGLDKSKKKKVNIFI